MKNIRHVIQVEPSYYHQGYLITGHILLGWLAWISLHGHFWLLFFILWGSSLFWSCYQASQRRFVFEMNGDEVFWDGKFYELSLKSKVGYGFLWLILIGPDGKRRQLWLFPDSVHREEYRRISRQITMRTQ